MANGKKNYFRHSFFARNDIKLLNLRDSIGIGFYFYYFSLLELCGEESSDELMDEYEFHNSTIRNLWGGKDKKCERIGAAMATVGLLEFSIREKSYLFRIPNLSKYLGKYTNKITSNTPNKRKEKESKVNKRKEKKSNNLSSINISNLIDQYNKISTIEKMFRSHAIGSDIHWNNFQNSIGFINKMEQWVEIFTKAFESKWLLGQTWFNFLWLLNYDNILKVQNGNFDENSSKKLELPDLEDIGFE